MFGADILQEGNGSVGHLVIVSQLSIGVIEWGDGIDEHNVDAAVAQGSSSAGRWLAEGVVCGPVAAQFDIKQLAQDLRVVGVQDVVHQVETALNKLRQQGDAAVGKILRTAAKQTPCRALDGTQ